MIGTAGCVDSVAAFQKGTFVATKISIFSKISMFLSPSLCAQVSVYVYTSTSQHCCIYAQLCVAVVYTDTRMYRYITAHSFVVLHRYSKVTGIILTSITGASVIFEAGLPFANVPGCPMFQRPVATPGYCTPDPAAAQVGRCCGAFIRRCDQSLVVG